MTVPVISDQRKRLAAFYDPTRVGPALSALRAPLEDYLTAAQDPDSAVISWQPPASAVSHYQGLLQKGVPDLEGVVREFLARATRLQSPRNLGHQVAVPFVEAAALDLVSAFSNQGSALFELSPASNGVEKAVIFELLRKVGWAEGDGIATHGGTLANVTAVLAARNRAYPGAWEGGMTASGVVFASADAHYSVSRALGVLGMGTQQLRKIPVDGRRRLNVGALASGLEEARQAGVTRVAVVASLCSTSVGSFDPLEEIAALCKSYGVWLHVDGAHGASALFSRRHRALFRGIEHADSLTWDAHKLLLVPGLVTFLLFRDKSQSYGAFKQDAPYLFDPEEAALSDFNAGLRTFECTRRAMAFSLWGLWSLYGESLFEDIVDVTFATAADFHALLEREADFEAQVAPESNIVCFRYRPSAWAALSSEQRSKRHATLKRKIIEQGRFYISRTTLDGEVWLRVTVMNPTTEVSHLRELLAEVRRLAHDGS